MSDTARDPSGSLSIPVEVLVIVAEYLAGDLCFGTIANLNATSWTVHEETLPVLYETTIWDYKKDFRSNLFLGCEEPEASWKHIK
jgi:hypothetical protein